MRRTPRARSISALAVAGLFATTLAACTGSTGQATAGSSTCPTAPVRTVVSVDQWGDIVSTLGGDCAEVTTVIQGSAVDPHDYEPSASDLAAFDDAQLVVVNGLDYDAWAARAADTASKKAARVDAAQVVGAEAGANPHLWYSPTYVSATAAAVTAELSRLAPQAAAYFAARAAAWETAMKPYFATIAAIKADHAGTGYAATESVFAYLAGAVGLQDVTPQGYRDATANEAEPSPGDLESFESTLEIRKASVLVVNTQTEGTVPAQLRAKAESSRVPVVEVTESIPPGADSFVTWQVGQLEALQAALTRAEALT